MLNPNVRRKITEYLYRTEHLKCVSRCSTLNTVNISLVFTNWYSFTCSRVSFSTFEVKYRQACYYAIFVQQFANQLRRHQIKMGGQDVFRFAARKWNRLNDEQKKRIFEINSAEITRLRIQYRDKLKDLNYPSGYRTPTGVFFTEMKKSGITNDLDTKWKALSDDERAKYLEIYRREKKSYQESLVDWLGKMKNEGRMNEVEEMVALKKRIARMKQLDLETSKDSAIVKDKTPK